MLYLLLTIPTGFLAWNIVEPESFLGALGFIVVWGILDYVVGFLVTIIISALMSLFN